MMGSGDQPQHQQNGFLGDTTLTKVFVGGLAWETQKDVLREHFDQYGDIHEAVIISDKLTGRSKGYGFVTFKDSEAANKACKDPSPTINGRRANCNIASLGARRPLRSSPPAVVAGPRIVPSRPPPPWYYHQHYAGAAPYYPAASAAYGYPQRQFPYPVATNRMLPMPVYPVYHFHNHQSQSMGIPAHHFQQTSAVATVPTIISKPAAMPQIGG